MKKFLAICLTLAMLLSCFTVVSFAAKKPAAPTHPVAYIDSCDVRGGWAIGDHPTLPALLSLTFDTEDKTEGEASMVETHTGELPVGSWLRSLKFSPIDASEMTHLCFDFYISEASKLSGKGIQLELTSSGVSDVEEILVDYSFDKWNLEDGWNYLSIPLSDFHASVGTCDMSAINFIRLFSGSNIDAGDKMVTKLDNIRFEDRGHVFTPADDEADYLYKRNGGGLNGEKYFMDVNGELIYRFEIPEDQIPYVTGVQFTAKTGSQLLLQASSDGFAWTTIYDFGKPADGGSGGLNAGTYVFDLLPALDFTKSNEVWVRIADSYPSNGWGGNLYRVPAMLTWSLGSRVQRATTDYYKFSVVESERNDGVFAPLAETEAEYLFETTDNKSGSGWKRFRYNDHVRSTTYKFEIDNPYDIASITFSGKFGAQLEVSVSLDNQKWTTVHAGTYSETPVTIDLTSAISLKDLENAGVIYVKIGDHHPYFVEGDKCSHGTPVEATAVCEKCTTKLGDLNGNGGRIYCGGLTVLAVTHNPPPVEMAGAVAALRRVFNSFELLKVCPFLSRFFSQQIEILSLIHI